MKYLCLIYASEVDWANMQKERMDSLNKEYFDFTNDIKKSGQYVGGDALQPTQTATTVRVRNGKISTTDGPFAETKEQLGGYYIVEAENLDEAVAIAARIPGGCTGSIEVRPIMKMRT